MTASVALKRPATVFALPFAIAYARTGFSPEIAGALRRP